MMACKTVLGLSQFQNYNFDTILYLYINIMIPDNYDKMNSIPQI